MMLPQDIIGQKVWLDVDSEDAYYPGETVRVQAEITQPTAPPWYFARYLNAPRWLRTQGQWLTHHEAEMAVLLNPVLEEPELVEGDDDYDNYGDELTNGGCDSHH
ncbi:hypothetical protein BRW62_10345 [Parathermosynechococcus lividus PCC 6715]|uniref:Uncharacterized protein n=1 Tax=Parathermosynechococcus lividus PCC 6715 TaxID=1917166 RepID=A0A2D2Q3H7_PARLV|nr:hypothetical protein [Thermostichus lividus]ATS19070.1 hypothetical protein BRW62_10345 [Thermostichus lividus PCC 6715]